MKRALQISGCLLALFILANAWCCGFVVYDYHLTCTRCLRSERIVEKKFCGITYPRTEKLTFAGYDLSGLTGAPCQHIYREGGFGRQTYFLGGSVESDGEFPEGVLFRFRMTVLRQAFQLDQRFPDKDLMRETMNFADRCLPPDATVDFMNDPKRERDGYLLISSNSLENAQSGHDWKAALEDAKSQMASDEKAH